MTIVGFTGTQEGMTLYQKRKVIERLRSLVKPAPVYNLDNISTAVHGDCIGADEFFGITAYQMGFIIHVRPGHDKFGNQPKRANTIYDKEYPSEPYLDRNHKIVLDADLMLATPKTMEEERRSGTWATIRYARKMGVPVEIIWPKPMNMGMVEDAL